jgi:hypothetical protein
MAEKTDVHPLAIGELDTEEKREAFRKKMRAVNYIMTRIFQLGAKRQRPTQEMLNRVIDL